MRISDWSSDVCSSDLKCGEQRRRAHRPVGAPPLARPAGRLASRFEAGRAGPARRDQAARSAAAGGGDFRPWQYRDGGPRHQARRVDRKSVVWGKSVSVMVDLGGGRSIKKKKTI